MGEIAQRICGGLNPFARGNTDGALAAKRVRHRRDADARLAGYILDCRHWPTSLSEFFEALRSALLPPTLSPAVWSRKSRDRSVTSPQVGQLSALGACTTQKIGQF